MRQMLRQRQEMKNYCDRNGHCTVDDYLDEAICDFYVMHNGTGLCTFSAWQGQCLSRNALIAARVDIQVGPEYVRPVKAAESAGHAAI
jgi:hypothetical protein